LLKKDGGFVKLTKEEKTLEVYEAIKFIDHQCFVGVEAPPADELLRQFEMNDVFILRFDYMKGLGFGPIVGYAIVRQFPDIALLWQIAVSPSDQGYGHGTILLHEVNAAYNIPIELTVKVDNDRAQVLYLKNGYRVKNLLRNYYKPEGHGLLMRREAL
jgi:ribosomal protein S18 acetylase RimI-like enzyme